MTLTTVVVYDDLRLADRELEEKIENDNIDYPIVFFQQNEGRKWRDILDRRTVSKFLVVSDKFANIIKENLFTGIKFIPIKLIGLAKQEVNGYTGLLITGKCGPLNYKNSVIIERQPVPGIGKITKYYRGVEISDWDGSDFFSPIGMHSVIVTQKVKEMIDRYKFTNVELEDLDTEEIDEFIYKSRLESGVAIN